MPELGFPIPCAGTRAAAVAGAEGASATATLLWPYWEQLLREILHNI